MPAHAVPWPQRSPSSSSVDLDLVVVVRPTRRPPGRRRRRGDGRSRRRCRGCRRARPLPVESPQAQSRVSCAGHSSGSRRSSARPAGRLQAGSGRQLTRRSPARACAASAAVVGCHGRAGDAVVVGIHAEVDPDQVGRRPRPGLGDDGARDRVAADIGIAVLGQVRGEVGHVRADLGDRERDRRSPLERDAERRVAHLGLELTGQAKGHERSLVGLGVSLSERLDPRPQRLGLSRRAAGVGPAFARVARAHRRQARAERDRDRRSGATGRRRNLGRDVAEDVAERRGQHVLLVRHPPIVLAQRVRR